MISIIIPTYKRDSVFKKTIRSVAQAIDGIDGEVIVVNDDKEADIEAIEGIENLTILNNPKSGVASARNYGAKEAKGTILIFVDNDMIIHREALLFSIDFLGNKNNVALNFNWTYPTGLIKQLEDTSFGRFLKKIEYHHLKGWMGINSWRANEIYQTDGIASCFLAIKRADFEKIGGYNENIPFSGFEDYVFKETLVKNKIELWLNTQITMFHNEEDRIIVSNWMAAKEKSGKTRRAAFENGYEELEIKKTWSVRLFLMASRCSFMFDILIACFPNIRMLDPIYCQLMKLNIGIKNYKGYFS